MKPKNIKQLQSQSRHLQARWVDRNTLVVESTTSSQANHVVTVEFLHGGPEGTAQSVRARCTCPWAMHNGTACSHVMAALEYLASKKNRTLSFWASRDDARRQKNRMFYLMGNREEDGVWITSRTEAPIDSFAEESASA